MLLKNHAPLPFRNPLTHLSICQNGLYTFFVYLNLIISCFYFNLYDKEHFFFTDSGPGSGQLQESTPLLPGIIVFPQLYETKSARKGTKKVPPLAAPPPRATGYRQLFFHF